MGGARIARAAVGWRRQVRHVVSESGERRERGRLVEVARDRRHAERAQQREAPRVAGERVDAAAPREQRDHALRDVAEANDEQASHNPILA